MIHMKGALLLLLGLVIAPVHGKITVSEQAHIQSINTPLLTASKNLNQFINIGVEDSIVEGKIYDINRYVYSENIAIGISDDEIFTFVLGDDNDLTLSAKQSLSQSNAKPYLSSDGLTLYLNSSNGLGVYTLNDETMEWQLEKQNALSTNYSYYDVSKLSEDEQHFIFADNTRLAVFKINVDYSLSQVVDINNSVANLPNYIRDVEYDAANNAMLISGRKYSEDQYLIALLAIKEGDTNFSIIDGFGELESNYSDINDFYFEQNTQRVSFIYNNMVHYYTVDFENRSLTLDDQVSTTDLNGHYRYLVAGGVLTSSYNYYQFYPYDDISNTFLTPITIEHELQTYNYSLISHKGSHYWYASNYGLNVFQLSFDNSAGNGEFISSNFDGKNNLPRFSTAHYTSYLDNLSAFLVVNNDGIYVIKNDEVKSFKTWESLQINKDYLYYTKVFEHNNSFIMTSRGLNTENNSNSDHILTFQISEQFEITAELQPLTLLEQPIKYAPDRVREESYHDGKLAFNISNSLLIAEFDDELNTINSSSVDFGLYGVNLYNVQTFFNNSDILVWDSQNAVLYTVVTADNGYEIASVNDFSELNYNGYNASIIESNLIFSRNNILHTYSIANNDQFNYRHSQDVNSISLTRVKYLGDGIVMSYRSGNRIDVFAVHQDSGQWRLVKEINSSELSLIGIQSLSESTFLNANYVNNQLTVVTRGDNYNDHHLTRLNILKSPVASSPLELISNNSGSVETINLNDFYYDPDSTAALTYALTAEVLGVNLTEQGILSIVDDFVEETILITVTDVDGLQVNVEIDILTNSKTDIKAMDAITVNPSQSFVINLTDFVSHSDGDEFKFSSVDLPASLTLSDNGILHGFITEQGVQEFTVKVTDAHGLSSEMPMLITVNSAPETTQIDEQIVMVGEGLNIDFNQYFSDQEQQSLTYTVTNLPQGLRLNDNGVLSGNITESGSYSFVITATDSLGLFAMDTVNITVNEAEAEEEEKTEAEPVAEDTSSDSSGGSTGFIWLTLMLIVSTCRLNLSVKL